jgi:hypothetical protein
MDIDTVRDRATAFCGALDAGDVEAAAEYLSPELRRNLGEVLALMPLPTNESTVVSVELGGSGYNIVLRLLGETDEVELQTRWKDRDGEPTMIEASHLSQTQRDAADATAEEGEGEPAGAEG